VHALDLDAAFINDEEGCQYLADEFFYGGNNEYVVLKAQEENDEGSGHVKLEFRSCAETNGQQAGQNKSCKNAYTA
jgi:hypothetical protein